MKKSSVKNWFKGIKNQVIGSLFVFACSLSISFGCSLSITNRTDFGSQMTNVIRRNNKSEKYHYTYWRCEPIESRRDWLGWGVKSYLTSLANPWATYGDVKNNNCFLFTSATMNQTFIRHPISNELVPVSVFTTPSSRSLVCFDFQLENKKSIDTKYGFYCSGSLAELLDNKIEDIEYVVNCGSENVTTLSFDGIIKNVGYDFASNFVSNSQYYIVLPYMLDDGTIISYDMHNYTGQASFYAVMKGDRYENNYYSLMINAIYSMGGVKDQLCYKASFIDKYEDLFKSYDSIESKVQSDYIGLVSSEEIKKVAPVVIGIILILAGIGSFAFLILKKNPKLYSLNRLNTIISSSFGLIAFWLIGEFLYTSSLSSMLFWDIGSRIFAFIAIVVVSIIATITLGLIRKNRQDIFEDVEFYSIDI